ncbi:MAG: hypothetical protein OH344_04680 [Candidatus Parvarchaeota archaeon]|nr:hypothetical protein [Candidatus Jingweiarchaeum tengchongense]
MFLLILISFGCVKQEEANINKTTQNQTIPQITNETNLTLPPVNSTEIGINETKKLCSGKVDVISSFYTGEALTGEITIALLLNLEFKSYNFGYYNCSINNILKNDTYEFFTVSSFEEKCSYNTIVNKRTGDVCIVFSDKTYGEEFLILENKIIPKIEIVNLTCDASTDKIKFSLKRNTITKELRSPIELRYYNEIEAIVYSKKIDFVNFSLPIEVKTPITYRRNYTIGIIYYYKDNLEKGFITIKNCST